MTKMVSSTRGGGCQVRIIDGGVNDKGVSMARGEVSETPSTTVHKKCSPLGEGNPQAGSGL